MNSTTNQLMLEIFQSEIDHDHLLMEYAQVAAQSQQAKPAGVVSRLFSTTVTCAMVQDRIVESRKRLIEKKTALYKHLGSGQQMA
ncbi:hypothetical protein HDU91_001951 [Kappamyces sp. JEL0680]|nr:hypothetical protein HDU91_001951 [Kappamyces sp. JEL0680]